jgi:hypothetical protein
MPLMTRLSSTRRAPGWLLGNSGSIADHARSESQNVPAIVPPATFWKGIRQITPLQELDWVLTLERRPFVVNREGIPKTVRL